MFAGDIFFVVIVKAGVRGAAVATVLAQLIAFIVCAFYMVKKYDILRLSRNDFKGMESAMVKNMLGGRSVNGLYEFTCKYRLAYSPDSYQ